jgi:hypothetical protein
MKYLQMTVFVARKGETCAREGDRLLPAIAKPVTKLPAIA